MEDRDFGRQAASAANLNKGRLSGRQLRPIDVRASKHRQRTSAFDSHPDDRCQDQAGNQRPQYPLPAQARIVDIRIVYPPEPLLGHETDELGIPQGCAPDSRIVHLAETVGGTVKQDGEKAAKHGGGGS